MPYLNARNMTVIKTKSGATNNANTTSLLKFLLCLIGFYTTLPMR